MPLPDPKRAAALDLFEQLKGGILNVDPVAFCEKRLKIDGKPFAIDGTGWQFLSDIYRYVGLVAPTPKGKPVVCVKGRQVGATTMAAVLELYFMTSGIYGASPEKPPIRLLHCFPVLNNVNKYSKLKLDVMMRGSVGDYVTKHGLAWDRENDQKRTGVPDNTMGEKFFENDNFLAIDSNGLGAPRLQGMTLDGILHDEVQRMLKDDINNGLKTLTASNYGPRMQGIQLYFGTPLFKGSYFWQMWDVSDQRYYYLGCKECGHHFLLHTPGSDEWEDTWLYGEIIKCPKCGKTETKTEGVLNGKWIPTKTKMDNGAEPLYVGFHFNQFLIPGITKEIINNENPKYNPTKSQRIWQTDVLGEFYSGSAMPITEEEILQYCKVDTRGVSTGIGDRTVNTYLGLDWGLKDDSEESSGGQSYSTVVILSEVGDKLVVENAFKMKKNEISYQESVVAEVFRRYNINQAVADIGFGKDIVAKLQKKYQHKLFSCLSNGTVRKPITVSEENLMLTVNKDRMLDDIFNMFRSGNIKFPLGNSNSYEQLSWLIEHCASMEMERKTIGGNVVTKYKKGNSPNDGLMGIMYAFLAWKMVKTKMFSVQEHKIGKLTNMPLLVYAPRLH